MLATFLTILVFALAAMVAFRLLHAILFHAALAVLVWWEMMEFAEDSKISEEQQRELAAGHACYGARNFADTVTAITLGALILSIVYELIGGKA